MHVPCVSCVDQPHVWQLDGVWGTCTSSQILTSTPVTLHLIHALCCPVPEENEQPLLGAVGVLEHISKCLHSFLKREEKYGIKSPADSGKVMQEGCDNFHRGSK